MNLRETLKSYLQRPYESIDSFLGNVIYPVFGEDKFVFDGNYNVLKRNPELQPRAEECGIQSLTFVGHILTEGQELNIFDITVNSHRQLARSRVAIQSIVKSLMGSYSGAFMIFHYRTMEGRWDWRFTFCQKGASNSDTSDAKRYTFLLGPSQSCRTAAENFIKIHDKIEREGEFEMDDIVRAFDVEALSKEFFDKYVDFYQNYFVKYMCDEANGMRQDFVTSDFDHTGLTAEQIKDREEKPIRDYLKKLLGRLVFLQFLQKKGWMGVLPNKAWGDGDYDFMRQLFLHATPEQQANFLDGVLEPLFTALNTQRPNDLYDTQVPGIGIVKIPYLNGGLFERDSSDEPITVFPAEYFGKLLEFFYEYNFTIDENDPNDAEVGVDPEMLGKIFESQLEDNKDKGAFYTPKEIVQYMCRESLIAYLTNCAVEKNGDKFPREETEKAVRNLVQTPEVIVPKMKPEQKTYFGEALRTIKICDPAIGSGAFPMGLLNELVRLRIAIGAWADKPEDVAALKKEIIQNNIYGVDIEQGAIDIARLRFWLSIMVDLEEPEALPNFDYKFMQGNSLITTFGGEFINLDTKVQKHERWEDMDKEKHVLYDLKKQYYTASGEEKLSLGIKIKDSILRLISMQLGYESRSWVASHSEQLSMFEEAKQLSFDDILEQLPEEKKRVINLCKELHAQLENKSLPLATRAHTDIRFFDWRMMFTEVFDSANPGFDVVIGNPPYGAKLSENDKKIMKQNFSTAKSINGVQKASLDTYTLFIEHGYNLLHKDGVLTYIIPISFTSSDSLAGIHKLLKENCSYIRVSSYAVRPQPVFEHAVVNTSIIQFEKTYTPCESIKATKMYRKGRNFDLQRLIDNLEFAEVKDMCLIGRIPKISSPTEISILKKVRAQKTLAQYKDEQGDPFYYRTTGGRYFKVVTNYPTGSNKEKPFKVKKEYRDAIGCILSSNLSFWFYQIYSNNLDWKGYELESFTIPELNKDSLTQLGELYKEYQEDIENNANVRVSSGESRYNVSTFKEYKIGRSKAIIDKIDDIICPLYGLTNEEKEFIKNYEIEFRLSDD